MVTDIPCRICGCTDSNPCVDEVSGDTCYWVETDLCSFCSAEVADRVMNGGEAV